jgi:hypothetical protein
MSDEEHAEMPELCQQPGESAEGWNRRLLRLDTRGYTEAQRRALTRVTDQCHGALTRERRQRQRDAEEAEIAYQKVLAAWRAAPQSVRDRLRREIVEGKLT